MSGAARTGSGAQRGKTPLGDEKAVSGDAQAGMMMEAAPAPPLEVAEPDLLLELTIITFDAPPSLGSGHQFRPRGALRQGGQPVLGRLLFPLGPFDQQAFLGLRFASPVVPMRRLDTHRGNPKKATLAKQIEQRLSAILAIDL